jgi:nitrate reductase gamma subunit
MMRNRRLVLGVLVPHLSTFRVFCRAVTASLRAAALHVDTFNNCLLLRRMRNGVLMGLYQYGSPQYQPLLMMEELEGWWATL